MAGSEHSGPLSRIRELAVVDPRAARNMFLQMLSESPEKTKQLLSRLSAPNDGRVRQLVASSVRSHPDFEKVREHLESWLIVETDEFARRAIRAAIEEASHKHSRSPRRTLLAEKEVYSYVSDRITHEIRNGLYAPKSQSLVLKALVEQVGDVSLKSDLLSAIAALDEGLVALGRLVEFQADDEAFFELRTIKLSAWLRNMTNKYRQTYGQISLTISGDSSVLASDYLLRLIFWNQWTNAHRILKTDCHFYVKITQTSKSALILVSDNGQGYEASQAEMMFKANVSKEAHRGRGLLELHDAVQRLQGTVKPFQDEDGTFRLQISLPRIKD